MIAKKQYNDSLRKVDRAIYVKCKLKFYPPPKPANQYVNSIKQIDTGNYVKCNWKFDGPSPLESNTLIVKMKVAKLNYIYQVEIQTVRTPHPPQKHTSIV